MQKQENDLLKKIISEELQAMIDDGTLDEGVFDVMGAKIAGGWSKGFSGDETRSTAKKVQRIIKTHRKEMQKDFAALDITAKQVDAVDQVLSGMESVEKAAEEYVHGKKAPSQRTTPAPTPQAATGGGGSKFDRETPEEPERFQRAPGPASATEPRVPQQRAGQQGISVFSGRRGKGLQSTLDRLRVDPKIKNLVLKAVAAQLKKQGANVLEEAPKYTFSPEEGVTPRGDPAPAPPAGLSPEEADQRAADRLLQTDSVEDFKAEYDREIDSIVKQDPQWFKNRRVKPDHLKDAINTVVTWAKEAAVSDGKLNPPTPDGFPGNMMTGFGDPAVKQHLFDLAAQETDDTTGDSGMWEKLKQLGTAAWTKVTAKAAAALDDLFSKAPEEASEKGPEGAPEGGAGLTLTLSGAGGLESQLSNAGLSGDELDTIVKAITAWADAEGLQLNESQLRAQIKNEVLAESRYNRWSALAGVQVIKG